MRHKMFSASCMVAVAVIGAAPAYADANNHNNTCQITESAAGGGSPGNAATSPGSVFNEAPIPGTSFGGNSPSGGTGGQAYSTAQQGKRGASQYDRACAVTSANGTATPAQTSSSPTQIANNSLATRNATNVMSHTGNGPK